MPQTTQSIGPADRSHPAPASDPHPLSKRLKTLGFLVVGLALLFCVPLFQLARLSFKVDLYSHVLLVPFISVYLAWTTRRERTHEFVPAGYLKLLPAGLGLALVAGYFIGRLAGWKMPAQDGLAFLTLAFVCFLWSACLHVLGKALCRKLAFPLLFLLFTVPFPKAVEHGIESVLQHGSADVAYMFIKSVGTPILRDGTLFRLPNIDIQVAPECSGIRSSLVLFMTALLAGYMFLRQTRTKLIFGSVVLGLGIVRNAFRIFVLAELCVHVDPNFIHSPLHHRGGPVFFAISLIPFFLVLWLLRRWENRRIDRRGI